MLVLNTMARHDALAALSNKFKHGEQIGPPGDVIFVLIYKERWRERKRKRQRER